MEQLIIDAMENLNEDQILKLVHQALNEGISPNEIINYVKIGVDNVGKKFENGEYFIADLMMSGIIFKEILEIQGLQPLDHNATNYRYSILLGTVFEDLHDIGKDIFGSMAKAAGFQVFDLGIDVAPDSFSKGIMRLKPDILALSGVLFSSIHNMGEIIKHLEKTGLRDTVKIIVGGGALTKEANDNIHADAYTNDASKGLEICKNWAREMNENNGKQTH